MLAVRSVERGQEVVRAIQQQQQDEGQQQGRQGSRGSDGSGARPARSSRGAPSKASAAHAPPEDAPLPLPPPPLPQLEVEELDLGSLDSVRAFAARFNARTPLPRLDLLICNAGVMAPPARRTTRDGLEEQFQVGAGGG